MCTVVGTAFFQASVWSCHELDGGGAAIRAVIVEGVTLCACQFNLVLMAVEESRGDHFSQAD